jgi:hypothetical protein
MSYRILGMRYQKQKAFGEVTSALAGKAKSRTELQMQVWTRTALEFRIRLPKEQDELPSV